MKTVYLSLRSYFKFATVLLVLLGLGYGCTPKKPAFLKLHGYVGESAVFQRDKPITIKGFSNANTTISATLGLESIQTEADEKGYFSLKFAPLTSQVDLTLTISTADTLAQFKDIAIGDVWFASGQSNMEWPLSKTDSATVEVRKDPSPNLRFFTTPRNMAFSPIDTLASPQHWIKSNDSTVLDVSGVAYHFAKKIQASTQIPIGVVISSWGGTNAETWLSEKTTAQFPYLQKRLQTIPKDQSISEIQERRAHALQNFVENTFHKGIGLDEKWYLPQTDLTEWKNIRVPGYWEDQDDTLKDFDGAVWYRRSFDLIAGFAGKDILIWLSRTDDHNQVWINGTFIGETFNKETWTNYLVPAEILKETDNEIVMRIFDTGGKGGTTGLDAYFDFYPEEDTSVRGRINGIWLSRRGVAYQNKNSSDLNLAQIGPNEYPTLLFNAMVHPYQGMSFKGVIWYQGESNKEEAYRYRKVFPSLIKDWRVFFQESALPFYFVQIANFGAIDTQPIPSAGAELREAQAIALELPYTGMASTLDIGDAQDIHPRNKKDVGLRLARHALQNEYGFKNQYPYSPGYLSHVVNNGKMIVTFQNAERLETNDGNPPNAFAIAGADGLFKWAEATIKGNTVILHHPTIKEPVHVRYAWGDAPVINLFNAKGLPVNPFRTDSEPPVSCCVD
ncbi:MAG: sialate O-acetylesterase [Bacteroidota bacterium]